MGRGEYLLFSSWQHDFIFTQEAQKMKTSILWNVWVLLAMPVVWMSWWVLKKIVSTLSQIKFLAGL
jgi:hypothetical protein